MNKEVTIFFGLLLTVDTLTSLYGLLGKKEWFWDPDKGFQRNPLLSMKYLLNSLVAKVFGKYGVVILNILLILLVWTLYFKTAKFNSNAVSGY